MGYLIPASEMSPEMIRDKVEEAHRAVVALAIEKGVARTEDELMVRAFMAGDASSTNFKDITLYTSPGTGVQEWLIDSGRLTAGDYINVISETSGEEVAQISDSAAVVFFGFADASGTRDLVGIRFGKGAKTIDHWQFSHIYATNSRTGYARQLIQYGPKDTLKLELCGRIGLSAQAGEDYLWVPLALIAEPKSKSAAASG